MKPKIFSYYIIIFIFIISLNSCSNENTIIYQTPPISDFILTLQPNSIDGKDAVISSISPTDTINYGSYPTLEVITWTLGGVLNINRALLRFDLSSIPQSAKIDSAYLSLFFGSSTNPLLDSHKGDNRMWVQRIIEPWNENSVTWDTQPKITEKSTVWIDKFKDYKQNYENIDIAYLVLDIFKSGINYGLMIRLQNEIPWSDTVLASSDHPDSSKHPKLVVYYHTQ